MRRRRCPRLAWWLADMASWCAPRDEREALRCEWRAELLTVWHAHSTMHPWSLIARAAGAFPHAWSRTTRDWRLETVADDLRLALETLGHRRRTAAGAIVAMLATLCAGLWLANHDRRLVQAIGAGAQVDALVIIETHDGTTRRGVSRPDVDWLRRRSDLFTAVAPFDIAAYNVTGPAESLPALLTTDDLFTVLDVAAVAGQRWADDEVDRHNPIMISEALWRRRYDADPAVVGRLITLDDSHSYRVAGVLPASVHFPGGIDVYRAMGHLRSMDDRTRTLWALARTQPGVTASQAARALHLSPEAPASFVVTPARTWARGEFGDIWRVAPVASAGLVLLAALIPVLWLTSSGSLQPTSLSVKRSLGASSTRLWRPPALEASVLMLIASSLAAVVTGDMPVTAVIGAVAVATMLVRQAVATVTPTRRLIALRAAHMGVAATLTVGLMVTLATTALLSVRGWQARDPLLFSADGMAALRVAPPWRTYNGVEAMSEVVTRMVTSTSRQPGVTTAAAVYPAPLWSTHHVRVSGEMRTPESGPVVVARHVVTGPYFSMLRRAVLDGRVFTDVDRTGAPPVIVLSRRAADALGAGVHVGGTVWFDGQAGTVIGIVDDVSRAGNGPPDVFVPLAQVHSYWMYLLASGPVRPNMEVFAAAVADVDATLGLDEYIDMEAAADASRHRLHVAASATLATALVIGAACVVALFLTVASEMRHRQRELAIRVALGAGRAHVWQHACRPALLTTGAAVVVAPWLMYLVAHDWPVSAGVATVSGVLALVTATSIALSAMVLPVQHLLRRSPAHLIADSGSAHPASPTA